MADEARDEMGEASWRRMIGSIRDHYQVGLNPASSHPLLHCSEEVRAATTAGPSCYSRRVACTTVDMRNRSGAVIGDDSLFNRPLQSLAVSVPSAEVADVVKDIAFELFEHQQLQSRVRKVKAATERSGGGGGPIHLEGQ